MSSPLTFTLAPSAARTADGEGASFDCLTEGRSAGVTLEVTAGSGGTLTTKVETSDTGLGDWEEAYAFKAVTAPTKLSSAFGRLKRYIRTTWALSGSFTFKVTARVYAHLISYEQLSSHLGPRLVDRLLDDAGAGSASEDAVNALLGYASSMLRGKVGDVEDLGDYTPESQDEIVRIGLDICQARAAIRHPELVRMDGLRLMEFAKGELREIRLTSASLGSPKAPKPDTESHAAVVSAPRRGYL